MDQKSGFPKVKLSLHTRVFKGSLSRSDTKIPKLSPVGSQNGGFRAWIKVVIGPFFGASQTLLTIQFTVSYSLCKIHLVQETRKIFYVDAQNYRFFSARYGSFLVESPTGLAQIYDHLSKAHGLRYIIRAARASLLIYIYP